MEKQEEPHLERKGCLRCQYDKGEVDNHWSMLTDDSLKIQQ